MEPAHACKAYTPPPKVTLGADGEYHWPGGKIVTTWAYSLVNETWYVGWHTLGTRRCLKGIPCWDKDDAKSHWCSKKHAFHWASRGVVDGDCVSYGMGVCHSLTARDIVHVIWCIVFPSFWLSCLDYFFIFFFIYFFYLFTFALARYPDRRYKQHI